MTLVCVVTGITCLLVSQLVFSAEIEVTTSSVANQQKWISRIISEEIYDFKVTSNTNPECTRHFEIYRQHQLNLTTWALQMFDSSDMVPAGFLVADSYQLGNFEECIDTHVPEGFGFSAQYCLASFEFGFTNYSLKPSEVRDEWEAAVWNRIEASIGSRTTVPRNRVYLAFCIPSTCSSEDLRESLQNLLEEPMRRQAYDLNLTVSHRQCTTKGKPVESNGHRIVRCFIIAMTAIVLLCSVVDILLAAVEGEKYDIMNCSIEKATGVEKWLLPFSFFRNVRQLVNPPTSPEDYGILHGYKVVYQCLVIVGHHLMFTSERVPLVNWNYLENLIHTTIAGTSTISLPDLFFCITGFILAHSMLKQLERNTFNVWMHIFNKLIRTIPPYAFVLACWVYITPYLDNGPIWKTVMELEVGYCEENWWPTLLFINNYVSLGEYCLPHSHYMAIDMHFFIVGSVIVYLCWRWETYKVPILATTHLLSFCIPFMIAYHNHYDGVFRFLQNFLMNPRYQDGIVHLYMKSHNRFGGYIAGISGAFLANYLLKRGYKFSKVVSWAGVFIVSSAIFATASVGRTLRTQRFPTGDQPSDVLVNALYASLSSQIIGTAFMIGVIIQITTGFGALNSLFLTQSVFIPFSRLGYWAFLINVPIVYYLAASIKTPTEVSFGRMFYDYTSDIVLTYSLSLFCYLIVEAPINHVKPRILRYIFKNRSLSMKNK